MSFGCHQDGWCADEDYVAAPLIAPLQSSGSTCSAKRPRRLSWSSRWVRWPDWWLPVDRDDAGDAFLELSRRAEAERVEVACSRGLGRTGTALACLAVLGGLPAGDAVRYIRQHYSARAIETPWQLRYIRQFQP